MNVVAGTARFFFSILTFLIIILQVNPVKHFFFKSGLFKFASVRLSRLKSHVSSPDVTQGASACSITTLAGMLPHRISRAS
jgi:hypothetical protein